MNIVVGNRLKMLRKSKNMSQEEVADYLHVSQSTYARMESGKSHSWVNHISNICEIYTINPEELLINGDVTKNVNERLKSFNGVIYLTNRVVEQYEERIKELKKVIVDLKKEMNKES